MRGRFIFTNIKLKYASLAGMLTSSLGIGAFAQVGGEGSQPRPCPCKPPALPRLHPSQDHQAGEAGGEQSSAFIFGPSSLKISPPSCLITLPFDLNESRPAARPSLCPLSFKGEGRGDGREPPGEAGAAALTSGQPQLSCSLQPSPGRPEGGGGCALGLAGPVRAPARIGWRGFRGSPTLQLKGPPRPAARRAPPGPANLAIQPALSRLSALAPPPEKPGAESPAQRGWRRWPRTSTRESRR